VDFLGPIGTLRGLKQASILVRSDWVSVLLHLMPEKEVRKIVSQALGRKVRGSESRKKQEITSFAKPQSPSSHEKKNL
jgi:hypothetical protein